ncbi:MAG TPA: D-alanine--D-alanine ligase [Bacteroidia bacterium]|nr:D-alanine--D-alanine ligase [Bacteroidia bacterium]
MKLRIGIIFGGSSREREVSFAGGRTVYDNLDKSLFEPVPLFADSFGNLILINWEFIYKGSIRDFYPPVEFIPPSSNKFQVYAESLGDLTFQEQNKLINKMGTRIEPSSLAEQIDFAFLCLHGSDGEDGRIQGLLEFYRIPYSGSGILSSSIGMNKAIQKQLMANAGFSVPKFITISRNNWLNSKSKKSFYDNAKATIGIPCVVKSANQGSSIGVTVLSTDHEEEFEKAANKSFFIYELKKTEWDRLDSNSQIDFLKIICDIREGIGIPVKIKNKIIAHPEELYSVIRHLFAENENEIIIESCDGDSEILIEEFIDGKEFSCIVIENTEGNPVALPPTEIRKGRELFDYRSKYLPGLSRKITPIQLPDHEINNIRKECERLFTSLFFNVYARIDGFITKEGKVLLNDPNTTSGMMPSSFFFHQAAEIGLNPSQFITYIIRTSLHARIKDFKNYKHLPYLLRKLDKKISDNKNTAKSKIKIAVIMGGYSSERHISVESGRNVYEKLSSSEKYEPVPVFLVGDKNTHSLYRIPINILLKDNADDIKEKILHYERHPVIEQIIKECNKITNAYASSKNLEPPQKIYYSDLEKMAEGVFIALHGRPGEDGEVQAELIKLGLPFNGSGVETSQVTIDKFRTNEIIMSEGLHAAGHRLVSDEEWKRDPAALEEKVLKHFRFPFIAKPVDDGCSSAVKMIRNENELHAFAELIFRKETELVPRAASLLKIKPKEEFPQKKSFLIEELISKKDASHFLEITGGMLTHIDEKGKISYEIFEASEALSGGDVLSLEEKFLAGEGQNITPARYHKDAKKNQLISDKVKAELEKAARILKIEGYARIDAFVRIYNNDKVEVIFIEVNSLPGMTPATCIFHQAAIAHYKPYEFIDQILEYGFRRKSKNKAASERS